MKKFLVLGVLLFFSVSSFAAIGPVLGKNDDMDTVTINKNFRKLQREVNNKVSATPLAFNGSRGTGSTTPDIGTNAPALIGTSPYTWIDVQIDSVPCVMPVWRKQ